MRIKYWIIIILFIIAACKKDQDGDVRIQVLDADGQAVENAFIYSVPLTSFIYTDPNGHATFNDLSLETYEFYADYQSIGSGKTAVLVERGKQIETTIEITEGVFGNILPKIELLSPSTNFNFEVGEVIYFNAKITDQNTSSSDLKVQWKSDIDGLLYDGALNTDGHSSFELNYLSKANHQITIKATDTDGYFSEYKFYISNLGPEVIELSTLSLDFASVSVSWAPYLSDDFIRYEVVRTQFDCTVTEEVVFTTEDPNKTQFLDPITISDNLYCYYVKVINSQQLIKQSNQKTIDLTDALYKLEMDAINQLILHPTEPYLYIVSINDVLAYNQPSYLTIFDYEKREVINNKFYSGDVPKIALDDLGYGLELFVTSRKYVDNVKPYLEILDPQNLSIIDERSFEYFRTHYIHSMHDNMLVIQSRNPSEIFTIDRANLEILSTYSYDFFALANGMRIPNSNQSIEILDSDSDEPSIIFYEFEEDGTFSQASNKNQLIIDPEVLTISPTGEYFIANKQLSLYEANAENEFIAALGNNSLWLYDFAISKDGNHIFAAHPPEKSIFVYEYSSLSLIDTILTRGKPFNLTYRDNQLFVMSRVLDNEDYHDIEIFDY